MTEKDEDVLAGCVFWVVGAAEAADASPVLVKLVVCAGGGLRTLFVSIMLGGGRSDEFPEGTSGTVTCGMLLVL